MARHKIRPPVGPTLPRGALPVGAVKSAARVLETLELFADMGCQLTIVQVSEALSYPQSSTSALLRTLSGLGYLRFDPVHRSYQTTARLALLGICRGTEITGEPALVTMMKRLADKTGDSIALATRNGVATRYLHVVKAQGPGRLHMQRSSLVPLTDTTTGLAILSLLDAQKVTRLFLKINAYERPSESRMKLAELLETLRRIRERGYAYDEAHVTHGGVALSLPLPVGSVEEPLVLTVAGRRETFQWRRDVVLRLMRSEVRRYLTALSGDADGVPTDAPASLSVLRPN